MAATVTLSDVAREAGVSLATASRAINGSANRTVREDLRERVLAAAARLRYSPDANAQAMARGRTTSLGLVVHDIADPYFSSIAAGVSAAADRSGLAVTLASTRHDQTRERGLIEVLQRQRARAIIIAGGRTDDDALNAELRRALADYRAGGGSAALVGQPVLGIDTVVIDNADGAAALARALHGLGYREFAVLAGPAGHLTARERLDGFRAGLAELGVALDPANVIGCAFTRDGGYDGMQDLLRRRGSVELVFAVNDVMAVGAMAAARDAGVDVPGELAVAGFDDIVTLRDVTPPLTTVRVPLVEVGVAATELALAPPSDEPRLVHVEATVVLRASTPPRHPSDSASNGHGAGSAS
ncbi:LacI family DNA-binding transcriptional regulator [Cellulomonas timonensis]|uniref:LacI family DNA-binding transcriptional regulator n=1 Tax=Cellulomonas timonensis TaxID=1689271 RepID=UPI00082DDA46|nr:LacI family DNA-binding transcriptional regulator [Cellulomonas timonensis]